MSGNMILELRWNKQTVSPDEGINLYLKSFEMLEVQRKT